MENTSTQATTPETGNEGTENQQQEQETSSKLALAGSSGSEEQGTETEEDTKFNREESADVTKQEQKEIEFINYMKSKGELPKGVDAIRDEDGRIKFIVPMDGKKYKVPFKQLISGFNLEHVGSAKLNEAKALQKQIEDRIGALHPENPDSEKNLERLLDKLGHKKAKLAEKWLQEEIENAQKTPEELAKEQRYRELEEKERKLKEREQEIENKQNAGLVKQRQDYYTTEVIKTMQEAKLDGLKPELKKRIMTRIFGKLYEDRFANQGVAGFQPMTPKEALDAVLDDYQLVIEDSLNMYGMEAVKKRIPKDFLSAIMKDSLNTEDQPKNLNSFKPKDGVNAENKNKPQQKKMLSDW